MDTREAMAILVGLHENFDFTETEKAAIDMGYIALREMQHRSDNPVHAILKQLAIGLITTDQAYALLQDSKDAALTMLKRQRERDDAVGSSQ